MKKNERMQPSGAQQINISPSKEYKLDTHQILFDHKFSPQAQPIIHIIGQPFLYYMKIDFTSHHKPVPCSSAE
jgi:hypothetical protein